ncbi:hypothetical protein [Rhodospirillaceae bacterium SYSU D60014]|uniref:hypothetical protein n=1 Tax=Virgifigura deserti TaxID=2268457 RepID=UPI000E66ED3A
MKHRWARAGTEPTLAELLSDPITHQLLKRDRLSPEMVWSAIRVAQDAMRRRTLRVVGPAGEPDKHGCEAA